MKRVLKVLSVSLMIVLISSLMSCNQNPIPKDGTSVTTVSPQGLAYKSLASDLADDCKTRGCTCFIDGIQSSCALTFACLDAGFCKLVKVK